MLDFLKKIKIFKSSTRSAKASFDVAGRSGSYGHIATVSYDGEKNLGEIGNIKEYSPNYELLRLRSWQSFLESELTQTVLKKFTKWVIGSGLKLQSEPNKFVLENEGIKIDFADFSKLVESYFSLFSKSKKASHDGMSSLNQIANECFLNARVGGDVLVVMRLIKGNITIQLIDGCHVCSPHFGNDHFPKVLKNGNIIKNGIEFGKSGNHIAYHVRTKNLEFKRILAKDPNSGLTKAFMVFGMKYRLDNTRGLPAISVVLETLKKLERYKEATVGSAEERQKVAFTVEHGLGSSGENPLLEGLAKAVDANRSTDQLPKDTDGKELADLIAATTNKQVFNMPQDSSLKMLESKNELYFKEFYETNIGILTATLEIPPEVAMSNYNSNYSASRAALKDWEHTLNVARKEFTESFYQLVYSYWLHVKILQNKISAPGYINALSDGNSDILESYRGSRFIGASVPHIDPVKEANAERIKLGGILSDYPLTTPEKATEALSGGDNDQNILQVQKDVDKLKEIQPDEPIINNG